MRAVRCLAWGEPETLVVEDIPPPRPGRGEVLIDVAAASVNYPDVLLVRNEYQMSIATPFTPGSDFAGTVRALGEGTTGWRVGERACGTVFVGAFAEQVAASTAMLMRVPDAVPFATAAAFPVVYTTAYDALRSVAAVRPGDDVLVLGAAGGIGSAAIELAKLLGARVIAAASSDEKLAACRTQGADEVVNYATEDLKTRVKALTGDGADVVLDPVGGRYAEPALRAMAIGGRFVVLGFAAKEIPRIPLNLVLLKGVEIRAYDAAKFWQTRPEETRRNRDELMTLLASGRLHPLVSATYPLERAAEALRAVFDRRAIGKLVIEPGR
ncbi:MAG TPA: NADPH:quinone oxidoreductase family protein [Candidatus Eisenbacteria bacterium]|nr:NADPH:quinone oxidoreductase family protein [Candidatus Eisenbacteria bacterium]